MWCKWRFLEINIHFIVFTDWPLFASKQTFARIDLLRQGARLVDKKGTHNVKFIAKKLTNSGKLTNGHVNKKASERVNCSFLVPRKVRFLATTMSEQARHCSFGLTKTFTFRVLTQTCPC